MVKVTKGMIIEKANIKSGNGDKGFWVMGKVYNESGKDSMTVFATNPGDLNTEYDQKVVEIEEADKTYHKYNEAWQANYVVRAKLESVGVTESKDGFVALTSDDIPF